MDGDWSSPNPVAVIRRSRPRNLEQLESGNAALSCSSADWRTGCGIAGRRLPRTAHASIEGSKRNIGEHYDLSNDFFRLFLDRKMVYSSGIFHTDRTDLDDAQTEKVDRICRKLRLQPGDRVLEIGTGWGAFALHAAKLYGCRVTTTTISQQKYDGAAELFARVRGSRERPHRFDFRGLPKSERAVRQDSQY